MRISKGYSDDVVYQSPGVVPDYGNSADPALANHEHPLLDRGKELSLTSPWENLLTTPAYVYKSADWCLLEGVIWTNGTAVSDASNQIGTLSLEHRPSVEHFFQNSIVIDGPFVLIDGDLRISTAGVVTMESASVGTNAVDRLFLHGIHWRVE